jgi:hypothetical protein
MRIIAVIPAWNARHRLPEVLDALAGQVAAIAVIDNGSADGTAAWLRAERPEVTLLARPENQGYARATNTGIAWAGAAGAEAVLLVNDDALFDRSAVAALADALRADPAVGAATAKLVYRDRPDVLNGAGGTFDADHARAGLRGSGEPDHGQYDGPAEVDYPSGAASLLRAAALAAVGGFDERYFLYFEDTDWGLRARAAGWRTVYVPAARVRHLGSAGTAADPARRRYYNVRNRLLLAPDHAGRRGRLWAWLATLVLLAKQPLRWLSPPRRRDAEAVVWAVADASRGRFGRSAQFG